MHSSNPNPMDLTETQSNTSIVGSPAPNHTQHPMQSQAKDFGGEEEEEEYVNDVTDGKRKCDVAWRFVIAFFGFFAMTISYAMRSHMSVTLVAMVHHNPNSTSASMECQSQAQHGNQTQEETRNGPFDWDEHTQGLVNGAFYWGYLLPQIAGGRLAEMYSAKLVILVGGTIGTIGTLIGPLAANINVGCFIASRMLCGLGLPCLHSIISGWAHPNERSIFSSIVYSGNQFGVVIAMTISGFLCEYASDGGWSWPFYVFGILGCVWIVLWVIFVYNSPSQHPWITTREKQYIEKALEKTRNKEKVPPVPWKKIFGTKAVWALICAHFAYNWGFYTLLTQLPTYMNNVLGFNIGENGLLSSLPYIVMMLLGYATSVAADFLIKRGLMNILYVRKGTNTIAMYGSALSLLVIPFFKCDTMAIYACLVLAVAFDGATYAGFQINHVDLSPNFAGTLQGITNTAACVPGIISPYLTGLITEGQQTTAAWCKVFYITMIIVFVLGTVYLIFGSTTLQTWNNVTTGNTNQQQLPVSPEDNDDQQQHNTNGSQMPNGNTKL